MTSRLSKKATLLKPYYETDFGQAYFGDSLEIMKQLPENSTNLILTSPPFALTRQKEYGNKLEQDYIDWFLQFSKEFYRLLKDDGSLVIDLQRAEFLFSTRVFSLQPIKTSNTCRMGDGETSKGKR